MRNRQSLAALVVVTGMLVGCGGSAESSDDTTTTESTAPASKEATTTTEAPTTTTTAAPTTTEAPTTTATVVVMPNVVCMNLQDAQDRIQEAGLFYSDSFDATGQDRSQLVDSNWQVVSQDPAPGTPIGEGDAMLGAVKYGESSPC